jgi:hypothetical protein
VGPSTQKGKERAPPSPWSSGSHHDPAGEIDNLWGRVSMMSTIQQDMQLVQKGMQTTLEDLAQVVNSIVAALKFQPAAAADSADPATGMAVPHTAPTLGISVLPRSIRHSFSHLSDTNWADLVAFKLHPNKLYLLAPTFAVPASVWDT